jgi:hypothetical protein
MRICDLTPELNRAKRDFTARTSRQCKSRTKKAARKPVLSRDSAGNGNRKAELLVDQIDERLTGQITP